MRPRARANEHARASTPWQISRFVAGRGTTASECPSSDTTACERPVANHPRLDAHTGRDGMQGEEAIGVAVRGSPRFRRGSIAPDVIARAPHGWHRPRKIPARQEPTAIEFRGDLRVALLVHQ